MWIIRIIYISRILQENIRKKIMNSNGYLIDSKVGFRIYA